MLSQRGSQMPLQYYYPLSILIVAKVINFIFEKGRACVNIPTRYPEHFEISTKTLNSPTTRKAGKQQTNGRARRCISDIWATGGIGHVTQQNRNIKIAIEQRARNCKIGEGGGLACQISGRSTGTILLRVLVLLLELLVLGLYSRRTKSTYKRDIAQINTSAMRNMMHDDMARWLVQGKIKWGLIFHMK